MARPPCIKNILYVCGKGSKDSSFTHPYTCKMLLMHAGLTMGVCVQLYAKICLQKCGCVKCDPCACRCNCFAIMCKSICKSADMQNFVVRTHVKYVPCAMCMQEFVCNYVQKYVWMCEILHVWKVCACGCGCWSLFAKKGWKYVRMRKILHVCTCARCVYRSCGYGYQIFFAKKLWKCVCKCKLGCPEWGPALRPPRRDPDVLGVGAGRGWLNKTPGCPGAGPRRSLEGQGRAVLSSLEPDPRSRPGDPETGPRRFRGRGRSGLTL